MLTCNKCRNQIVHAKPEYIRKKTYHPGCARLVRLHNERLNMESIIKKSIFTKEKKK